MGKIHVKLGGYITNFSHVGRRLLKDEVVHILKLLEPFSVDLERDYPS